MFEWLRRWLNDKRDVELHLHVHVHVSGDLSRSSQVQVTAVPEAVSQLRAVSSSPSAAEIAHVVLAGGMSQAVDKTSGGTRHTTANGVDSQVEAVKQFSEDKIIKSLKRSGA